MTSAQASRDRLPVGQVRRISDDREGLGLGVERQDKDNRELAARLGWEIVETYTDNSVSAYKGVGPETKRALEDLRAGRIRGLVAWHPDRIFGPPRELEDLIDLLEATGAQIATVQAGSYDLATPSGRLVARQLASAARYEREMKAERQRRKHLELAEAGKVGGGGTRPSGYSCHGRSPGHCTVPGCPHDGTMSIIEAEAALIREAARRIAAGEATRGVIADLTARGFRTPDRLRTRDRSTGLLLPEPEVIPGKPWAPSSFTRMITGPRIAGLRQYQGRKEKPERTASGWSDVAGPAVWPAIVDRATWEQVRQALFDINRKSRAQPRRYLLASLARCALCGAKLVSRPTGDGTPRYICAKGPGFVGCGRIYIVAQPLEKMVCDEVLDALDTPGLAAAIRRAQAQGAAEGDDIDAEMAEIGRKLDELEVDMADGIVDRRAYLVRRRRLSVQRDALDARLAARKRPQALKVLTDGEGPLRSRWPDLGFDQKRAILTLVVDRITIGPGVRGLNRFDPRRVEFTWLV
jgi:site-specific DNA recombinase